MSIRPSSHKNRLLIAAACVAVIAWSVITWSLLSGADGMPVGSLQDTLQTLHPQEPLIAKHFLDMMADSRH